MSALDDLLAACDSLASDGAYAKKTRAVASTLRRWAVTVGGPAPEPTPAPSPAPVYLFHDEFDGPAGSPPDPAKWVNLDGITYGGVSAAKASNAYLDGQGNLVLMVTREPWLGRAFAGALIGSYQYQTGWPPSPIRAAWPVPFRYEVRFKFPTLPGGWFGPGWLQTVDRSNGNIEIDVGETRGAYPTIIGCNMHTWTKDATGKWSDTQKWGQAGKVVAPNDWHVLRCDTRADATAIELDGVPVGAGFPVLGRFGVLLHNVVADVASWGAGADANGIGGQQPAASDPGPWPMRVDYVRVSALPA